MLPALAAGGALLVATTIALWRSGSHGGAWHVDEVAPVVHAARAESSALEVVDAAGSWQTPHGAPTNWTAPAPTPAPARSPAPAPARAATPAPTPGATNAVSTRATEAAGGHEAGLATGAPLALETISGAAPSPASKVFSARSLSSSCTTQPSNWQSSTGHSCQDYADNIWCTPRGLYGWRWTLYADHHYFDHWADSDGVTAVEACCECGAFRGRWQRVYDAGGCRSQDLRRGRIPGFTLEECQQQAQQRGHVYFDFWVGIWETQHPGPNGQQQGEEWTLCTTYAPGECDEKYAPYWPYYQGSNPHRRRTTPQFLFGRNNTVTFRDTQWSGW